MDKTLDLSWNEDEIVAESSEFNLNKKLIEAENMFCNLQLHYSEKNKMGSPSRVNASTNSIIKENYELKKRIAALEKKFQNEEKQKSPSSLKIFSSEKRKNKQQIILKNPDFSETSDEEFVEFSTLRKTRCSTKDFCKSDLNDKYGPNSNHISDAKFTPQKRKWPNKWTVKPPEKRFLQNAVFSQLPIFKF